MGRIADGMNIVLRDPATGMPVLFSGGDEPPEWASSQITNPAAWANGSSSAADGFAPPTPDPEAVARLQRQAGSAGDAGGAVPPQGGPGSGAPAWRAYAAAVGVEVAADADRPSVIAALRKAGKPVDRDED